MRTLSKKDIIYAIVTGLLTGIVANGVLSFLKVSLPFGIPLGLLVVVVPILWILGVQLGYALGMWIGFFTRFGKFAAIGFTNAAVDFGVLNLEIALSDIDRGPWFSVFKGVSFIVAIMHSYLWNKFWVFDAGESGGGKGEFAKFIGVAVVSFVINVSVASVVVNLVHPLAGIGTTPWASVGAIVGSAVALVFSFVGFRLAVFKKS